MSPPAARASRLAPSARALLVLLALLLAAPPAWAQQQQVAPPCTDSTTGLQTRCEPPDLVPSNLAAYATDERFPTELCGYALNLGQDSATPASGFDVELVLDGVPDGLQHVSQVLLTGDGQQVCWNVTLPAGVHTFRTIVDPPRPDAPNGDVVETNENNNVANERGFYVRPIPQPFLRFAAFDVSPTVAGPDAMQFMVATVENAGDANSTATSVAYYDDLGLVARLPVPALPPHQRYAAIQANWTAQRLAGNFTAKAVLDPDNATILECGNIQYVLCRNFTILPHPAPDLVVDNVTVRGSFLEHRGLLVDIFARNAGPRMAPIASLRVYDGDKPIANASQANVGPDARLHAQFYVVLAAGEHVLRVVVDPDHLVAETNESNNEFDVNVTIQGTAPGGSVLPDLLVERLDALPNDPAPGETVMVTALVRNVGEGDANATKLVLRADGAVLATLPVSNLTAGASFLVHYFWGGMDAGNHTLSATVDPDGKINQTTREDDTVQRDIPIFAPATPTPPPDVTPPTDNGTVTPPTDTGGSGGGGNGGGAPPPPAPTALDVTNFDVVTRANGGGLRGYLGLVVRNPNLNPVGRVSVTFTLDGHDVGDKIITGVPGAGTAAQRTDEMDLPPGNHTVSVDLKVLGDGSVPPIHVEKSYNVPAPKTPMPGGAWLVAALGALAFALRRRRGPG